MAFRQKIDGWYGRLGTFVGIYQAIPAGIVAAMSAYFSQSVGWIAALGPFGWLASGILAFLATSTGMWMLARSRLLRVEARTRERIAGDGSPFDPMERVYRNKRLYLRDLAPLGRKRVKDKKFINCEIIGPGTAIIGLDTDPSNARSIMRDCNTFDVDCIQIDTERVSHLAIGFWDCDFEGCDFYHMTLLFMHRSNETLHWITPAFTPQLSLLGNEHDPSQ